MKKVWKIVFPLLMVSVLLVGAVAPVFANSTDGEIFPPVAPTSFPDEDGEPTFKDRAVRFLENAYQKTGKLVEHVGTDLDRTENIEERIEKVIEQQQDKGEDTSDIQTALNVFLATIPDLEADYADAVSIYDAHAGFDADGKVTDIDDATDTIQVLKEKLLNIHRSWHSSAYDLREALDAYHDAHPKTEAN